MGTGKFETGMIIKGRDLKGYTLCKVLSEDMCMRGFQYQLGVNETANSLPKRESCRKGFTFLDVQGVLQYLHHGTKLAIISIQANEDVYVDDEIFRTHRLTIKKIMHLKDVATWKYLHKQGIDFTAEHNMVLRYTAYNGYLDVLKYLHKQGVDIAVNDNFAVKVAVQQGHLEIIKYLHENGADITVNNNSAIKWASCLGYEDIVKYLYENGADITKYHNLAV